jgi:hypothetical protein
VSLFRNPKSADQLNGLAACVESIEQELSMGVALQSHSPVAGQLDPSATAAYLEQSIATDRLFFALGSNTASLCQKILDK